RDGHEQRDQGNQEAVFDHGRRVFTLEESLGGGEELGHGYCAPVLAKRSQIRNLDDSGQRCSPQGEHSRLPPLDSERTEREHAPYQSASRIRKKPGTSSARARPIDQSLEPSRTYTVVRPRSRPAAFSPRVCPDRRPAGRVSTILDSPM